MKPMNSYVLVRYQKPEEKTAGGIYMPQTVTNSPQDILIKGTVEQVSESCKNKIEVNSVILFNKHAFTKIPDSNELILVREEDIYAIL
jgi:chaperonin GroES